MLAWSVPRGWRTDNPCREVKPLKGGKPYEPWSWEAIDLLRSNAQREIWWVSALALFTGQRQGDVLVMKCTDVRDGVASVTQEKTGVRVWIPIHRSLAEILAEIPRRSIYIATNSHGAPWTQDGFRTSWARVIDRMPLPERLVFQGLRKSAVVMLLEAGCTTAEVASITGQSFEMVEHYAREVSQRKLAVAAIAKWENAERTEFVQRDSSPCTTPPVVDQPVFEKIGRGDMIRTRDPLLPKYRRTLRTEIHSFANRPTYRSQLDSRSAHGPSPKRREPRAKRHLCAT